MATAKDGRGGHSPTTQSGEDPQTPGGGPEAGAGGGMFEEEPAMNSGDSRRPNVRRSLPVLIDPEDMDALLDPDEGRESLSVGNSPHPADASEEDEEASGPGERGVGGKGSSRKLRGQLVRHESLPSLHLNARCLKCDRVGTVYCKGCEAHFCAKHDRQKHRFILRKNNHEHEALPGVSYFRIPLPRNDDSPSSDDAGSGSGSGSEISAEVQGVPRGRPAMEHSVKGNAVPAISRNQEARGAVKTNGDGGAGGQGSSALSVTSGPASATPAGRKRPMRRRKSAIDLARSGWYDKIVMAIVRPPRCKYTQEDLGPMLMPLNSGLAMKRRDFVVKNRRGLKLVCSQWRPAFAEDTSQLPCVVYLHGNSSARIDVVKTRSLTLLGAAACTVVSFDFSGSGMSEGDWVTLGYFEQHDVADVLAYLRSNGMANRYLLWGRSMGAASALLYASCYPNSDLCGLILDSPFCSFRRLARDLVTEGQIHVPGFLVSGALGMLRHSVRKRTRCDLKTVAPITRARDVRCPCLFIAARKDAMVRPSHGAALSEAVGGASLFVTCRGTHNTSRPGVVLQAIGTFVKGCFRAPDVPISEAFATIQAKLMDAQATAAAMRNAAIRAGRSAASSSTAGISSRGEIRDSLSISMSGVGSTSGPTGGSGGRRGGTPSQRPPAAPGLRGREIERIRRGSSFSEAEARPCSAVPTEGENPAATASATIAAATAAADRKRAASVDAHHLRRRSKSYNAAETEQSNAAHTRRRSTTRSSVSSSNSSSSGGGGGGSRVLDAMEADAEGMNGHDGVADDGEVSSRVHRGGSNSSSGSGRGGGGGGKFAGRAAAGSAAPVPVRGRGRSAGRGIRRVFVPVKLLAEQQQQQQRQGRPASAGQDGGGRLSEGAAPRGKGKRRPSGDDLQGNTGEMSPSSPPPPLTALDPDVNGHEGARARAGTGPGASPAPPSLPTPVAAASPRTAEAAAAVAAANARISAGGGGARFAAPVPSHRSASDSAAAAPLDSHSSGSGATRQRGFGPRSNPGGGFSAATRLWKPVVDVEGPVRPPRAAQDTAPPERRPVEANGHGNPARNPPVAHGGVGGGGLDISRDGKDRGRWKKGAVSGFGSPGGWITGGRGGEGGGTGSAAAVTTPGSRGGDVEQDDGSARKGVGLWGRIRLRSPTMYVFRQGRNGSGSGGGFAARKPVSEFSSVALGRGGGPGSSSLCSSPVCGVCENSASACLCGVGLPSVEHDPAARKPSVLRTVSGKLKM